MTRHRLRAFFLLTFAISWGVPGIFLLLAFVIKGFPFSWAMYSPLYFVGVWGPAIAAVIVIGWTQGAAGLRGFLGRMLDWRFGWPWYGFALLGIPAMYFAAAALHAWGGTPDALAWYRGSWLAFIGVQLARATAGPVEELGWRGFALPLMQRVMHPWTVILVLGLVHGLWHAPVFVVGQFAHFGTELSFVVALARFVAQILAITVFFTIAYNATGGSLTLAFLIHWMTNLAYPWEGEADRLTGQTIMMGLAAILMALTLGRTWITPERAATVVTPGVPEPAGDTAPAPGKPISGLA